MRFKSFHYQAKSWTTPRRIVAKVEHHRGELFPRVGFIVTNMALPSRSVVRFYNKRGTAEPWIKEGKTGDALDAVVVPSFPGERGAPATERPGLQPGQPVAQTGPAAANQALVAHESPAATGENGGRLVKHARYYWLLLAEGHLTRRLFDDMLRRIRALPVPGG